MHEGIEERERALEGAFFARQDQELIEGLRKHRVGEELGRATGIVDAEALALLVDEGIRVETLVALLLAPLVETAWADARVTKLEQNTFHAELEKIGIRPSSAAGRILERWLAKGPPKGLMAAWLGYVEDLERSLSTEAFAQLGDHVYRLCRSEADSDGGVLRIGRRTSAREADILATVERAFALI